MTARFGDDTPSTYCFGDSACDRLYFGDDLIWERFIYYDPETEIFTANGQYTPPPWWRNGIDFLDIIGVGAGGGGGAYSFFTPGYGGKAGTWDTATTQSMSSSSLTVSVPTGGRVNYGAAGSTGGTASVKDGSTSLITAPGGAGGKAGGAPVGPTGTYGQNAGYITYEGVRYDGGGYKSSGAGNPPGGGGAGETTGGGGQYGAGARGQVWIVARQNTAVQ